MQTGEMIIFQTSNGETSIEVKLDQETVWLSLNQMAQLFERDKSVISRHLKNIYNEGELDKAATVAKNATVQTEGERAISRDIEYFNLDAILSVGYRVNSLRGTQFRIWANGVLKEYLTKGYALDQKKLREQTRQLEDLKQTVQLLSNVAHRKALNSDEAAGLFKVLTDYTYALDILDRYDHQVLEIGETTRQALFTITYPEAIRAINGLKDKFGGSALFGKE